MGDVRQDLPETPLSGRDLEFEEFVCEMALRLTMPQMSEFDQAWEIANEVCDRYHLGRAA
jgi:hypothetical protein